MKAQLRSDVLMHDVYFRLKFESFRGLWLKYSRDKKQVSQSGSYLYFLCNLIVI